MGLNVKCLQTVAFVQFNSINHFTVPVVIEGQIVSCTSCLMKVYA